MLRNSRFIVFLIIASMTYLTGCKDSGTEIIAILGTDYPYPNIGRTDSILQLFLNKSNGNAGLFSIPSDLYIYQSDQTLTRINTQFRDGGSELLFDTLDYNLGFRPSN